MFLKKTKEAEKCQKLFDDLKQKLCDAQQALVHSQKHFQAVSSGLSGSSDGQAETLSAQKIGILVIVLFFLLYIASKAPLVCLFDTMHWKKVEVGWLQHGSTTSMGPVQSILVPFVLALAHDTHLLHAICSIVGLS